MAPGRLRPVGRPSQAGGTGRLPRGAKKDKTSPDRHRKGRERLCLWAYEIIDHHDINRRTVALALSYFDRLVANGLVEDSPANPRLLGMTCLYVAIRIVFLSGKHFDAASMAFYSRGFFIEGMIVDTEEHICGAFD